MSLNQGMADGATALIGQRRRKSSSRSRSAARSGWPRAYRTPPSRRSPLTWVGAHDFTPVEYDPQYILMVNDLKKYFPHQGRHDLPYGGSGQGRGRCHLQPEAGHHHGSGGRVRLRQDHHRPDHPAAVRRKNRGPGALQRPGGLRPLQQGDALPAHQDADYFPGPLFQPVPPVCRWARS